MLYPFVLDVCADSMLQRFTFCLREHLRLRLWSELGKDPLHLLAQQESIHIKHDRIYKHATAQFNFTTYDVCRDTDVVHCSRDIDTGFSLDKTGIMVGASRQDLSLPWDYAVVLGIFHAQVLLPDSSERRMEFLWVRWFDRDVSWTSGQSTCRLERLTLTSLDVPGAVDFVDPAVVIRGCHIVPAFHYGRTPPSGYSSVAHQSKGDWQYYYINW
ncbi:hypothetical protein BC835DRAFT_1294016 [Cytidiella melzeri]|nr:hypothetical protein BC835DRAFT_1294016 [Cytidiella melzeri]